jgi:hypothetical protein
MPLPAIVAGAGAGGSAAGVGAGAAGAGAAGAGAGATAVPLLSEGAGAGATVSSAGGASQAGEAMGYVESAQGGLDSILNPTMSLVSSIQNIKGQEQAQKNFDQTFEENKRQFGLTLMLYNKRLSEANLNIAQATSKESLKGAALGRLQTQERMAWDREDREKNKKMAKAYSTGLLAGLGGQ